MGQGGCWINWRTPANKVKKQSPEMPLFPNKEGVMWMEVKTIWVLFLAIGGFFYLFISCGSQHSLHVGCL